jgi:class 3 adenylate cyclase
VGDGQRRRSGAPTYWRSTLPIVASGVPPSGTVTFLFTDVEGSTRLWDGHPAEMRVALERHDTIVRGVVDRHDGFVFSTGGDAFCVAFRRSTDALSAAVEVQRELREERWPEHVSIGVRVGLHAGEAHERGGDYYGSAVNRAARVMSLASGGQVVCSDVTAQLLRGNLPDGLSLVALDTPRV